MEFIISSLAKTGFLMFGYYSYKYYHYSNIEKVYTTSGQIDLSYEVLSDELIKNSKNRYFLICGNNVELCFLKNVVERYREKTTVLKDIKLLKLKSLKDEKIIEIEKTLVEYYDASTLSAKALNSVYDLKVSQNKENENHEISNKISIWTKLNYLSKKIENLLDFEYIMNNNDTNKNQPIKKNLYLTSKGILPDQKILVLGKIYTKNNQYKIKPKAIICSGMIEVEEIFQYLKSKNSNRMFQTVIFISFLSIVSIINNNFNKRL